MPDPDWRHDSVERQSSQRPAEVDGVQFLRRPGEEGLPGERRVSPLISAKLSLSGRGHIPVAGWGVVISHCGKRQQRHPALLKNIPAGRLRRATLDMTSHVRLSARRWPSERRPGHREVSGSDTSESFSKGSPSPDAATLARSVLMAALMRPRSHRARRCPLELDALRTQATGRYRSPFA
jgi:hypothetical protein